jgi:serine/threonine-protein kinase
VSDPRPQILEQAKRIALAVARRIVPAFLALVVTVVLFNAVIMPRFVRHGREVEVPEVTKVSLAEARQKLAAAGLAVRDTVLRSSPNVGSGMVLDQTPRAHMEVKPDRGIALVVSQGVAERRVPRTAGQSLRSARLTLGNAGYERGDVIYVPSASVARNFVVASDPPAGDRAMPGDKVHLLVSSGPKRPEWVMPDLAGQELQLTADRLNFAGFTAVISRDEGRWFGGLARVRSTDPGPGAVVAEGDTIRLYGR